MSGEIPTVPLQALSWLTATYGSWLIGKLAAVKTGDMSKTIDPDNMKSQAVAEVCVESPIVLAGIFILANLLASENVDIKAYSVPLTVFLISFLNTGIRSVTQKLTQN